MTLSSSKYNPADIFIVLNLHFNLGVIDTFILTFSFKNKVGLIKLSFVYLGSLFSFFNVDLAHLSRVLEIALFWLLL
jgi:hypothetical protein